MSASERRLRFLCPPDAKGLTVAKALHDAAGLSHADAKGIVASGLARVNGTTTTRADHRLSPGDVVEASWDPARRYKAPRAAALKGPGFRVVHEDDDVAVVEKAPGVLTVPAPTDKGISLLERLEHHYRKRGLKGISLEAVHRIDRYTSGLVAFARHGAARAALRSEFARGRPERVYLAVVEGRLDKDRGRLEHRLAENPKSLKVHTVPEGAEGRDAACTYRVLERFTDATLVEVRLETGRRNQIRVQFAAVGHPLVGDVAYGRPSPRIARVALHAYRLGFASPSGKSLVFQSEPPRDFRELLAALRRPPDEPVRPRRAPARRYR
ncbi:MAG TPA: RluA family pseudouridine synthase [Candidatus Polarisedimenticolaceae bacterium]